MIKVFKNKISTFLFVLYICTYLFVITEYIYVYIYLSLPVISVLHRCPHYDTVILIT
jgi:hypothetical protein